MGGKVLRRLAGRLLLLVVAASCAYLLAAAALHPRGNYAGQQPPPPPEVVDAALSEHNLNDREPLAGRYVTWVGDLVRGDLGRTWDGRSVNAEVAARLPVTAQLVGLGFLAGGASALALAVWVAVRRRGGVDGAAAVVSLVVVSVPAAVLAVLVQQGAIWLNGVTGRGLFLVAGGSAAAADGGLPAQLHALVLPTVTVALPLAAVLSRYQLGLLRESAPTPFVRAARARGLTPRQAVVRHALRVALPPMLGYAGVTVAMLFTATVFAEVVFGLSGIGTLLIAAIGRGDVNTVAAVGVLTAAMVVASTAASDLLRAGLDPRLRLPRPT